jgi:hypothetical protein
VLPSRSIAVKYQYRLESFAMPVFLTMSAWGILGKFEKWAEGTAPPPN